MTDHDDVPQDRDRDCLGDVPRGREAEGAIVFKQIRRCQGYDDLRDGARLQSRQLDYGDDVPRGG